MAGDAVQVNVVVGGRTTAFASRLSDQRFEGYVNPEAYILPKGQIKSLRSPWAETVEDIHQALRWFRGNASRHRNVERRKAHRFRAGSRRHVTRSPTFERQISQNVSYFLEQLETAGTMLSGSYVNIGANDGLSDDPLAHYARSEKVKAGGGALAIEADEELCAKHRVNLPWVKLVCSRVSTQNLKLLLSGFPPSARSDLDVLKVDIDSYDGPIIKECRAQRLRPKILQVEINAGIPPPLQFALLDSPQLRETDSSVELLGVFSEKLPINAPIAGVSLSYLVRQLAPEYVLMDIASPDAIFLRADIARDMALNPLDEFDAFARAWSDVHGFHRQTLRRWVFQLGHMELLGEELLEELDREEQPAERTYSGLTEFRVSRVTASSAPRAARRGPRDVASSATRRGSSTKEVTRRKMWRRQATAGCAHEICEVGHSTENSE
ncbi:unnamed protein product [Durusdinium trenchii]|uniref:Uncharacterized protein n=1 Tax=Durusdinium trenchii TaxID=1381693 RepID=A0ABP0HTL7_9DINO